MRPTCEPAAEVHDLYIGQLGREVQRHPRGALPHFGIGARADVTVQARDAQVEPLGDRLHLAKVLVPDPETRCRPAGVRAIARAAAQPGVYPYRYVTARRAPSVRLELVKRARVEQHAAGEVLGEPDRWHLRGELDRRRRKAGVQGALDLVVAGGVDVQPEVAEDREHAAAGIGFHRVAQREAEWGRKG